MEEIQSVTAGGGRPRQADHAESDPTLCSFQFTFFSISRAAADQSRGGETASNFVSAAIGNGDPSRAHRLVMRNILDTFRTIGSAQLKGTMFAIGRGHAADPRK